MRPPLPPLAVPLTVAVTVDHGMHLALCLPAETPGAAEEAALLLDSAAVVRLEKVQVRIPLHPLLSAHLYSQLLGVLCSASVPVLSWLAGWLADPIYVLFAQVVCHSWPDALAVQACAACEVAYTDIHTLRQELLLERCLLGAAAQICSQQGAGGGKQASAQEVALRLDEDTMLLPAPKPCQRGMHFKLRCHQCLEYMPHYWHVHAAKIRFAPLRNYGCIFGTKKHLHVIDIGLPTSAHFPCLQGCTRVT